METNQNAKLARSRTKYDLLSVPRGHDQPTAVFPVGTAFQYEGEPYYVVKLWAIPSATFYMVKKESEADTSYVVYSRVVQTDQGPRFSNPVGRGVLDPKTKTQLKLTFFLLGVSVSMSLYPAA